MEGYKLCDDDRIKYKIANEIQHSKEPIRFRNGLINNIIFSKNGHVISFIFKQVEIGNDKVGYDRFDDILVLFPQYDKIDDNVQNLNDVFTLSSGQQYDNNTLINTIIQQIKTSYILSSDEITSLSKKLDDIYGQEEI